MLDGKRAGPGMSIRPTPRLRRRLGVGSAAPRDFAPRSGPISGLAWRGALRSSSRDATPPCSWAATIPPCPPPHPGAFEPAHRRYGDRTDSDSGFDLGLRGHRGLFEDVPGARIGCLPGRSSAAAAETSRAAALVRRGRTLTWFTSPPGAIRSPLRSPRLPATWSGSPPRLDHVQAAPTDPGAGTPSPPE
jgi:hypothetical protein